jgi:hypothetical protein
MRVTLLALAVLLMLLGPAAATFGDNGLTTYTGRKRSPNTMVFGNDMVTEQALQATLNFAKDVLKGTWRPSKNDPPTPKQEVGSLSFAQDQLRQWQQCWHCCSWLGLYSASDRFTQLPTQQPRNRQQQHIRQHSHLCGSRDGNALEGAATPLQDLGHLGVHVLSMCCPNRAQRSSCFYPAFQVQLECLNSVAPAPLNWKMWCPGTDAKVVGWLDKSGAAHRQITLRPQAGMTSTMYQWFITTTVLGLMPPVVEFLGNVSLAGAHVCSYGASLAVCAVYGVCWRSVREQQQ